MPQLDTSFFITQLFWLTVFFSLTYAYISNVYLPSMVYMYKFNKKKINKLNSEISVIKENKENVNKEYISLTSGYISDVINALNTTSKTSSDWYLSSINELNNQSLNDINDKYINTIVELDYMYDQWKQDNKEYWSSL